MGSWDILDVQVTALLQQNSDDSKSGLKRGVFIGYGCTDMKLSGKVSDKVLSYIFDKMV